MRKRTQVNVGFDFPPGSVITQTSKHRIGQSKQAVKLLVSVGKKGEASDDSILIEVVLDSNGKAVVTVEGETYDSIEVVQPT